MSGKFAEIHCQARVLATPWQLPAGLATELDIYSFKLAALNQACDGWLWNIYAVEEQCG
jgi:hypothetical protein